ERFREVLDDVDLSDHADQSASLVDDRDVPIPARLHQVDRVPDGLVEIERPRFGRHERLDRPRQVHMADHDPREDVALRQHAQKRACLVAHEDRIARARALDRTDAFRQGRARRDGHGLASPEHAKPRIGQCRDATGDRALGEVGHAQSVVRPRVCRARPARSPRGLLASGAMDRRTATGIGLIVVSAAGYATGSVLARPIYDTGIDWLTLVQWRFLVGALLGWAWVFVSAERRASLGRLPRRALLVALALGALFTGNAGTYYAGLETLPAALAGVLVYTYPVIVAVLSLRFATRLPGRRPWIALVLAVIGSVLALGGIDVATAPPIEGLFLVWASALIYSVWIILSARLSGERRDRLGSDAPDTAAPADDAA